MLQKRVALRVVAIASQNAFQSLSTAQTQPNQLVISQPILSSHIEFNRNNQEKEYPTWVLCDVFLSCHYGHSSRTKRKGLKDANLKDKSTQVGN
jgi:hypothetical protein